MCPTYHSGYGCLQCISGSYRDPVNGGVCLGCDCNIQGSNSIECDSYGICTCKENVIGNKCEHCMEGYSNHPDCSKGKVLYLKNLATQIQILVHYKEPIEVQKINIIDTFYH